MIHKVIRLAIPGIVAITAFIGTMAFSTYHATPVKASARNCIETLNTDTLAGGFEVGATGFNEVDFESTSPSGNPCDFRLQARAICRSRTGTGDTALSGIVAAIELEAKATCNSSFSLIEGDWRYQETPSGAWSAWFQNYP